MNLKDTLINSLVAAIAENTGVKQHEIARLMEKPKNREHGDLAFPCFILAKLWKSSPPSCAERLKAEIKLPHGFSAVQAVGPYLNFKFDRSFFIQNTLREILLPSDARKVAKTVIVEYSSPNIAKPFHVGHLRATLIGNCLDRIYRHLGWRTISINHLGDWGTQFGFVWAGCKLWGFPEKPTVTSLVELYRRATALKSTQEENEVNPAETQYPDINEMARSFFLDLEKGEEYAVQFWQQCVNTSLEYLKATYKRLDITFDHYTGESFYSDKLEGMKQLLDASGLLVQSQGALGVDLGEQLGFARIFTPDGRSLYLTRDLATAKYRAETFNFDKSIYVVGAPQALHFQQLKAVLRALKLDYADKLVHVAFGHVLGMKTRGGGDFIELNEFLDEAYERALDAYRTQVTKRPEGLDEREVAHAVALSAILFSNLSRTNIKDVTFKWEHALEFQGDSGPYLLYACARINGIKEKASAIGVEFDLHVDFAALAEDSAYELVQKLAEFDEVLEHAAEENEPSILANYALELAKTFSQAYLDLKVIGEELKVAKDRLALFEAARAVLSTSLKLLGIEPLERM
jgi:arginyl-tRNA synthetase